MQTEEVLALCMKVLGKPA